MAGERKGFSICAPRDIYGDQRRYILVKEKINEQPVVAFVARDCLFEEGDEVNYVAQRIRQNEHVLPSVMPFEYGVCDEVILDLNSIQCEYCKHGAPLEGNTTECPSYSPSVSRSIIK